jgi:ligand-binding sensor domain-containing protein
MFDFTKAQWVQIAPPEMASAVSILISGNDIFIGTSNNGIFHSSNNGNTWNTVNNGLPLNVMKSLGKTSDRLFASTYYDIVSSSDYGNNWEPYHNGLFDGYYAEDFLIENNSLYAAGYGVYYSSDNGANWVVFNSGLPISPIVYSLVRKGNRLFAATVQGVYYSDDNGVNWNSAGNELLDYKVWAINLSGNNLIAGTDTSGIFISNNNGDSWTKLQNDFSTAQVRELFCSGGNVFAGFGFGWGIYHSSDNGLNWISVGQGLAPLYTFVLGLAMNDIYLFAATTTGVYRRALSEFGITSIDQNSNIIPSNFTLLQNYPNPFNPSTKISWQSPISGHQTLKVYDMLGNEVATLVDEEKPAGRYEINFNASQLSSGIYFYKFLSGIFINTKKMILMK